MKEKVVKEKVVKEVVQQSTPSMVKPTATTIPGPFLRSICINRSSPGMPFLVVARISVSEMETTTIKDIVTWKDGAIAFSAKIGNYLLLAQDDCGALLTLEPLPPRRGVPRGFRTVHPIGWTSGKVK